MLLKRIISANRATCKHKNTLSDERSNADKRLLLKPFHQRPLRQHLLLEQIYLGVSPLDKAHKLSNHARALCKMGSESLVVICEISCGSSVGCSLGVTGCCSAELLLQACNVSSITSAASFELSDFLRVFIDIGLRVVCMIQ